MTARIQGFLLVGLLHAVIIQLPAATYLPDDPERNLKCQSLR